MLYNTSDEILVFMILIDVIRSVGLMHFYVMITVFHLEY